jgi:anti-anti-sigma regulatory factor
LLPCPVSVLRIIQATPPDGPVVLRLEGQLRGRWVDELRRVSSEILQKPASRLELDLAEVSFLDAGGVELLRELSSRRVALSHCSLFVAQQLKIEGKP